MSKNAYRQITDEIVAAIKEKPHTWIREWALQGTPLKHDGTHYQGMNVLCLWAAMSRRGYKNPHFMTYNQAKKLGGFVRPEEGKGKGGPGPMLSVKFGIGESKTQVDDKGNPATYGYLKTYQVWNVEQIEGLPDRYYVEPDKLNADEQIAYCEEIAGATGIAITHGGDKACYSPLLDKVMMPPFEAFHSAKAYYATLWHELCHATGHKSRLDRNLKGRFGDHAYAAEELVAELGAAFLCAKTGLEPQTERHAGYLQAWLKMAEDNDRAMLEAAKLAGKAADWIMAAYAARLEGAVAEAA